MDEMNQAKFEGWARVEVMGHQTHIGHVTTQAFGQAVMFRIDHPEIKGTEETLTRAEWIGEVYAQPGSVVKREDIPALTVLVGAGSIYRIVPCDEATALKAIRSSQHRPLMPVRLVESKQLPPVERDDEDDDDVSDSDDYMPGGF